MKKYLLFLLIFVELTGAYGQGRIRRIGKPPIAIGINADTTDRELQFSPIGELKAVQKGKPDIDLNAPPLKSVAQFANATAAMVIHPDGYHFAKRFGTIPSVGQNAIYYAGGLVGTYYERLIPDAIYHAEWFPAIKGDYNPATGTGTDDLTAIANAIAATPDGWMFQLQRGKHYRFGNNTVTLDGAKTVRIDINQANLWQTANKFLFDYQGQFVWTQTVSALTQVDSTLRSDYSTSSRVVRITLSSPRTDLRIGDVLKLTAENVIPNSRPDQGDGALARMGEFVVVAAVDGTGKYVYTTSVPYELSSYTTNVKVSKLSDKTFSIGNGGMSSIDAGDSGNWLNGFVKATNCGFAEFERIKTYKSWGPTLDLRGLYKARVRDVRTKNADTKASNNVGYLIRDIGCQYLSATELDGENLRHVYATNQSYIPASELASRLGDYGRSMHNKINFSNGNGCNGGTFDAHSEAYDITYNFCTSNNNYVGAVSSGEGFKIRGKNIKLIGCISKGHKYGIQLLSQYAGGTNGVYVQGGEFEGWESAVRSELADTGDRVLNANFNGVILSTTGQDLMSVATSNLTFENCIMTVDNVNFTRFIVPSTSSNITAINNRYICNRSSATLLRIVALNGSNARADVWGGQVISNKDVDRLIHTGTFTGGRVGVNNLQLNRDVLQVVNTDNVSTYAYSYRVETNAGVRSKSGVFEQTISANGVTLDGAGCLDDERQRILTPSGANRTGLLLPAGLFKGQKEIWFNASGSNTIEVNGSVTATNGTGRAYWNGTTWINY